MSEAITAKRITMREILARWKTKPYSVNIWLQIAKSAMFSYSIVSLTSHLRIAVGIVLAFLVWIDTNIKSAEDRGSQL